jgi:hypothetical protein
MKRILKILLLLVLTVSLPLSMAYGQDKKTEKKVKVVIADKDGETTIIDTTFTGDSMPHSITLKDGKVVVLDSPGEGIVHLSSAGGKGNIYVTCTEDEDGTLSHQEKVIVMSGDNAEWTIMPSTGSVRHIYAKADTDGETEKTEKYIIVKSDSNKDAVWEDASGRTFHVTVDSDIDSDVDTNTDVTKYVIAKDGVVITVESKDEDKAKNVLEALEKELDIKK